MAKSLTGALIGVYFLDHCMDSQILTVKETVAEELPYWYNYVRKYDPREVDRHIEEIFIDTPVGKIHSDYYSPFEGAESSQNRGKNRNMPQNGQINPVMIPGTSIYGKFYADFCYTLAKMGYRVFALDLPGHGLSDGKRGDFTMRRIMSAVGGVGEYIKSSFLGKTVIIGSSLGGITALYTLAADLAFDAAICHNAAVFSEKAYKEIIKVPPPLKWLLPTVPFLAKIFPNMRLSVFKYLPASSLVNTPEMYQMYQTIVEDPSLASKYTFRSLNAQMSEPPARPIEQIDKPIMFINGEFDQLFSVPFIKSLYDRISHPQKQLKIVKGAAHLLFQENCEYLAADVDDFLTQYLVSTI